MSDPRLHQADVGIVGAGPAGYAAATTLAALGRSVVVLDEGQRPGGQIFRQLPVGCSGHGPIVEPPSHDAGHRLLAAGGQLPIDYRSGAVVWDARVGAGQSGQLYYEQDGVSRLLQCQHILLAPGAYDRCLPFPGWTLPGVVTAGALQVMVRGFGVVPGRRALVVGSGPLLLPTVLALTSAGVEVVAALEAVSRWRLLRSLPVVLWHAAKRREAMFYARQLLRAGVRMQFGWTVFACEGEAAVQRAVIGKVDATGRPLRHTARTIEVDVVGAGFGLVPAIELGLLLGAQSHFLPHRGGHCLVVDDCQRTSVATVYAAGEICGIGGAEVAMAEGELAALAIHQQLGGPTVPPALRQRVAAERKTADAMLAAFLPLPGLHELADAATIVCRCEDVPLARAREAAALHGETLRGIKVGCRAGMGPCQGRICGPSLQALATGKHGLAMDLPVVQLPVKPVRSATIVDAPQPAAAE